MNKDVACILLAGGIGERLYPISSPEHPKFLLKTKGRTLIEDAYERAVKICVKENVYIVSTKTLKNKILQSLPDFNEENFIEEPERKNTLPAFIISFLKIPEEKKVLVFFPCDHIIEKENKFIVAINKAIKTAKKNFLTLIGIKPSEPSPHYGYIIPDKKIGDGIYSIKAFEEKPEKKRAKLLIKNGGMWNSGIYILSREKLKSLLITYQKEILEKFENEKDIKKVYEELTPISFDKGITEKEKKGAVVRGNFYWCDIGTQRSIMEYIEKRNGTITGGNVHLENCKRVIAISWNKPLFMNGLCDIIILINGEKAEIRSIKNGRGKRR